MTTSVLHTVVTNATNLSPNTRDKYLRDLNAWIAFAGSDPRGWTKRKAQAFYADLLKRMKSQSANRLMSSVRFAARWWAIQEDNPDLNFAVVQEAKATLKDSKQALTEEQATAILDTCRYLDVSPIDLRDFAMLVTALDTGMRRMSLQSMRWEWCFLDGDAMGFPTARVLMKGTQEARVAVPMSQTVIVSLKTWASALDTQRSYHRSGPVFQALPKQRKSDGNTYHVPSTKQLSEAAIHKIIADRGKLAGIELSPHVFRHTFVTWRFQAGYVAHEISAVTHHKLRELGAMAEYIDPIASAKKMCTSTPPWLAAYVARRLGR